jgi:glucose-1-phosphate adenylyltransferase
VLASGGCIISGSVIRDAVLFSSVRIHSACTINQAVIMPNCEIGRYCRLSKVVIDRGCTIPEGMVIGEDAELDAKRFYRTANGVVLVTCEMMEKLRAVKAA